jgi:orotate phosphoribosyltransferase
MSEQLITIRRFDDSFEADLARAFLEDHGIQSFLTNELVFSMLPGIANDRFYIELQVSSEDEEQAREILDAQDSTALIRNLLTSSEAILDGHFVLTSGLHSPSYVEKIKLLQDPQATERICELLSDQVEYYDFDTVVGPAYGGIVLAFEVARIMGKEFVFSQRKDEKMTIRSGFDLARIHKAVVVEDIVTTGGSLKEVIDCLRDAGVETLAVACIVDRSSGNVDLGVPLHSLLKLNIATYQPDDCELCRQGLPLTKPGASDKKV